MFKKKLLSMALSLAVAVGAVSSVSAYETQQYYPDVDESHWAYQWVGYMHENGYIHGYPDGNYRPAQYITRAEYVTILHYIFNSVGTTDKNYIDVIEGDWYYDIVHAAVASGYLHGYNDATDEHDGTMKPNNYITREEAAVVIADAYGLELNSDVSRFSDSEDISWWAVPYVGALSIDGVLLGDADTGAYRPKDNMLRAEVASMIAQAESKKADGGLTLKEKVTLPEEMVKDGSKYSIVDITPENIDAETALVVSLDAVEDGKVGDYKLKITVNGEVIAENATLDEVKAILAEKTFTAEEIEALKIEFSGFDKAEDQSKLTVTVKVTDGADKEYDAKVYELVFTKSGGSGSGSGSGSSMGGGSGNGGYETPSIENRDRVVECLDWYRDVQKTAMHNRIEADAAGNANLTNDKLMIILTNDGLVDGSGVPEFNASSVQTEDYENWDVVYTAIASTLGDDAGKTYYTAFKPVYEDVLAKAVLSDTSLNYKNPALVISTDTKVKYVGLFRAMVKVINASADAAVSIYNDPANSTLGADVLYNKFLTQAINDVASVLNNVYTTYTIEAPEKTYITAAALKYCENLFNGGAGNASLEQALMDARTSDGSLTVAEFAQILVDCINGAY